MNFDEIALNTPTLNTSIRIDNSGRFLKELLMMFKKGISGEKNKELNSLPELLIAVDLSDPNSEKARQLVNCSMNKAICELILSNEHFFYQLNENELQQIEENQIDRELYVNGNFFDDPSESPIVKTVQEYFEKWLINAGIEEGIAKSFMYRLPCYFVYALNQEWQKNRSEYEILTKHCDIPFFKSELIEVDLRLNSAWLNKQVYKSVFGEPFSLTRIYTSLSAFYEKRAMGKNDPPKKIAVDLKDYLEEWLDTNDRDDAIRVIIGPPGSGKSLFTKIFCSEQTKKRGVLFIPLYSFVFSNDIAEGIETFLRDKNYQNLINNIDRERGFLIVFDGLEDLRGNQWKDVIRRFVDMVVDYVNIKNSDEHKINVLITGRDIFAQSTIFSNKEQVLHLLPYYVTKDERNMYLSEEGLLERDKRDTWWRKFGKIIGKGYVRLPDELRRKNLGEITKNPLLNYLIALSYARGKVELSSETNINTVYEDMINDIYERKFSGRNETLKNMTKEDFFILLEEMAVSVWHSGSRRIITGEKIRKRFENAGLSNLLEKLTEFESTDVINLFIASYYRRSGSEEAFEFVLKSFCEYLIARRVVRQFEMAFKMLQIKIEGSDKNWLYEKALEDWIKLCGHNSLDVYCFEFIRYEVKLKSEAENGKTEIEKWQETICDMIGYILQNGMPFGSISNRENFKMECKYSINAEIALLAVLSACSYVTGKISNIEWGSTTAAGAWISNLFGQYDYEFSTLARKCLNHISFRGQCMIARDLISSNLCHCDLRGADLSKAHLADANLSYTLLTKANLNRAHLHGANLHGADLCSADLSNANLFCANLFKAGLSRANLSGAELVKANLTGAVLQSAALLEADLTDANFGKANLGKANLSGANLSRADLRRSNLRGADLSRSNLRGADLTEADLTGTVLIYADLTRAGLSRANLVEAVMSYAKMTKADLSETNLAEADLNYADIAGVDLHNVDLRNTEINNIKFNQTELGVNDKVLKIHGKRVDS